MRNLQEQVKKAFCYQTFCKFSSFSLKFQKLEQFFLTMGQNNFGEKYRFRAKHSTLSKLWIAQTTFFVTRKLFKPCRWQIFLGPHFFCNLLRVIKTLNFAPWKKPHDTHFENCHSNCHSILDYNHLIQEKKCSLRCHSELD